MKIPQIFLVESHHRAGSLAKVLAAIAEAGLVLQDLESIRRHQDKTVWELTLEVDPAEEQAVIEKINALPNARVLGKSDRVFKRHLGGKIRTVSRRTVLSMRMLRDVYTPGVAQVCLAIQKDPSLARTYTSLASTVAIVTNGTAILGLGAIGAVPGLPVMEGKAALFAELVGLSGVPILLNETDPQKIVEIVCAIAPSFGAIQLEDIAAPTCFEVEEALMSRLGMPVMHDDQHGTATVVLAAILNACHLTNRDLSRSVVGQIGLGAAGLGLARLLQATGTGRLLGTDLRPDALERLSAVGGEPASLDEIMAHSDIVVALSGVPGLIKPQMVRQGQIILALSNPEAEISPRLALEQGAAYASDGRSVNNILAFPGLFKGALESGVSRFTEAMYTRAARCLAQLAPQGELVPDPLDRAVHQAVAVAVYEEACGRPYQDRPGTSNDAEA